MNTNESNKSAWLIGALGLAFTGALAYGIFEHQNATDYTVKNNVAKARIDSLNTVKNDLRDEVETYSVKLVEKTKSIDELTAKLENANASIQEKSRQLNRLRNEFAGLKTLSEEQKAQLATVETQLAELNEMKLALEEELKKIPVLEENVAQQKVQISEWETKYGTLTNEYNGLQAELKEVIYEAPADHFKVESAKGNEKLTAKAKKTKNVKVSFTIPSYLKDRVKDQQTIYLSLVNDKLEPLKNWNEEVSVNSIDKTVPVQVHASQTVDYSQGSNVVTFDVPVSEKLKAGVYTAKVYTKDDYLGSVEFRLRNSFWFF
jgi:DNA repair exonuclease SbcCD ATPase subunit